MHAYSLNLTIPINIDDRTVYFRPLKNITDTHTTFDFNDPLSPEHNMMVMRDEEFKENVSYKLNDVMGNTYTAPLYKYIERSINEVLKNTKLGYIEDLHQHIVWLSINVTASDFIRVIIGLSSSIQINKAYKKLLLTNKNRREWDTHHDKRTLYTVVNEERSLTLMKIARD